MQQQHLISNRTIIAFVHLILSVAAATSNRRSLHQPLYPLDNPTTTVSQPPAESPQQKRKPDFPFSTLSPPDTDQNQFFPFFASPSPPPPPTSTSAAVFPTFPANISSLVLPPNSPHYSVSPIKLVSLIVTVSLLSLLVIALLVLLLIRHRHRQQPLKSDSLRLFHPVSTPSDTANAVDNHKKPPPPLFPHHTSNSTSSEYLLLGTLVSSRDADYAATSILSGEAKTSPVPLNYQRLGSPDLQPLPPLPRQHSHEAVNQSNGEENDYEEDDELYSPGRSTGNNRSHCRTGSSPSSNRFGYNSVSDFGKNSLKSNSYSPRSFQSKSPDSSAPIRRFIPPPPVREPRAVPPFSPSSTEEGGIFNRDCSPRVSDFSGIAKVPPPVPPPPPPAQVAPFSKRENLNLETKKPRLKPLHWDKVRASSDRAMVWDQLKSSSFQLNEEMIETLFMVSSSTVNGKDGRKRHADTNQENPILDRRKSQNIAILLRALNVTADEVCEALLEGNADTLGVELLESLLKMAPTKEEERKLKEYNPESPTKLGTAEAFLKSMLDIPFAFKRVDAMLYIANFESETEHLQRSFDTLESACKELKSSRMFLKLLDAVLKTGNHMNVGTERGDAQAFKLYTLLKLVNVKAVDGKTTLLHFVVEEIIRAEGIRLSGANQDLRPEKTEQSTLRDEVEFRKLGLQVVSGLSGELCNVKKVAAMDAEVLSNDVLKLAAGIAKISQVLRLNQELSLKDSSGKFSEFMNDFLKKAEMEIANIQAQEGIVLSMVKGLTAYFHGKEEAHPLRLFMVVRDFLTFLDKVCKDVGKMNERSMVNLGRQIQVPLSENLPPVFLGFGERLKQCGTSNDDGESPLSSSWLFRTEN